MTKWLRSAWEWLLRVDTKLMIFFHIIIWMPAVSILWIYVGLSNPSSSIVITGLKNISLTYLLFAPLLFELARDYLKTKRLRIKS